MQTRLVLVSKLNRILFPTSKYQTAFSYAASGGVEDATQGVDTEGETNPHHNHNHNHDDNDNDNDNEKEEINPMKDDNVYMHPKTLPPNLSSSKLQTPGVKTPFDPHHQQKRSKRELTCAGLDGSPWPEADDESGRREQDKHYFEYQKASPLSEIEILDSRKPLARVTDGGYFGDPQVITWRPDQLDTAEESLLRATEMFREAATRGVPDWPHSRRLRQLRGEDW